MLKDEFREKVVTLVSACTSDQDIKGYKERWRNLISKIKRVGREALIIKLIDQMENLPYYSLILDEEKKKELIWKHKFFISECRNNLKKLQIFKDYEKMVNNFF